MTPNRNHILAHLFELFDWAVELVPDARFEVRCLHPDDSRTHNRQFAIVRLDEGTDWLVAKNALGFNCYVVANLIDPTAPDRFCEDSDILAAINQFIDSDGVDDADTLRHDSYPYSMIVQTGLTPRLRMHGYFRLADPVFRMSQWRDTQKGLAHHFGTDATIHNPSRIVRVAGTLSYPPQKKRDRGYVTELTELLVSRHEVDNQAFIDAFPAPRPVLEPATIHPRMNDAGGNVPLCVVAAALAAIPPIGHGERNHWIAMCHAVIEANPSAQHEWDVYNARCVPHDGQAKIWTQLQRKGQTAGSHESLFKLACIHDPDWWRVSDDCQAWWQARAGRYYTSQESTDLGATEAPTEASKMGVVVDFNARRAEAISTLAVNTKPQTEDDIKADRRAATAYLRNKMRLELENHVRKD